MSQRTSPRRRSAAANGGNPGSAGGTPSRSSSASSGSRYVAAAPVPLTAAQPARAPQTEPFRAWRSADPAAWCRLHGAISRPTPRGTRQHASHGAAARSDGILACVRPVASSSQIRPSSVHFDVLLHGAGCAGRCNALVVVRPSISLARWVVARHRAPTRTRAPTTTRAPTRARSSQISLSHHLGRQAQSSRSTSTPRLQRFRWRSALHR